MSKTIYCISGLGADAKVFSNLKLEGYTIQHIPWLVPGKKENLSDYATRMAVDITEQDPIVLGVSFGGMVGIEIAKQKALHKLFIVSSVKSVQELPVWMKTIAVLQLNKIIPLRHYRFFDSVANKRLGAYTDDEKDMAVSYRKNADYIYVNWAVNKVVNWKNKWQPQNIIHIHGDSDKMFPIKKINATHVIKGGTHMMIYNRAAEVAQYIKREL
jgi:pimeloyl-ACP methyl ester carboxylesterase